MTLSKAPPLQREPKARSLAHGRTAVLYMNATPPVAGEVVRWRGCLRSVCACVCDACVRSLVCSCVLCPCLVSGSVRAYALSWVEI